MAIGIEDGQVLIRFERAQEWVKCDPQNAHDVGAELQRLAKQLGVGALVQPARVNSMFVKDRLISRVTTILLGWEAKKKVSPGFKAQEIVEVILSEVA
jgi:hypothetical protein